MRLVPDASQKPKFGGNVLGTCPGALGLGIYLLQNQPPNRASGAEAIEHQLCLSRVICFMINWSTKQNVELPKHHNAASQPPVQLSRSANPMSLVECDS